MTIFSKKLGVMAPLASLLATPMVATTHGVGRGPCSSWIL